jgi:hypothetical protein
MRKKYIYSIFIPAILSLSCSDLKKDLPAPTQSGVNNVHEQGWTDTASVNFHGIFIASNNYDMRSCQHCHGLKYDGGLSGISCLTCHSNPGGPENCATCHGIPPPPDRYGNTSNAAIGVGAHVIHFTGSGNSTTHSMTCSMCHFMPTSIYDPNHINATGRAYVVINDPLAAMKSDNVIPVPAYSRNAVTCANTFCHGSWRLPKSGAPDTTVYTANVMSGTNDAPVWTGGSTQTACGTNCHTNPPAGHKASALTNCYTCHGDVMDATGKIKNKSKHMNGMIDLVSGAAPFR